MQLVGYRVYLSKDDQERLARIQADMGFDGVVSVFRIAADRCYVKYPDETKITKAFRKTCEQASHDLADDRLSACKPVFLQLGRYFTYVQQMAEPLGFDSYAQMIRALLLMLERVDI
jgi:hypothetical protein